MKKVSLSASYKIRSLGRVPCYREHPPSPGENRLSLHGQPAGKAPLLNPFTIHSFTGIQPEKSVAV